jgi:hypothetical protein
MTEDGDSKPVCVIRLRSSPRRFGCGYAFGNLGETVVAVRENALRPYLPTMDLGQQPHPGKNLRQAGRQGEEVGDIMIATRTTL